LRDKCFCNGELRIVGQDARHTAQSVIGELFGLYGGVCSLQSALNLLIALAALIAILDWFGIKPSPQSWGVVMPPSRRWKLAIMLGLVAASLGLSGYAFYRTLRPKIVEKIVEKPVEKLVSQECPKPDITKQQSVEGKEGKPISQIPIAPPQTATGDNNAQVGGSVTAGPCSNVQIGGTGNQANTNCLPPSRHVSPKQAEDLKRCLSSYQGQAIELWTAPNQREVSTFGNELEAAFKGSGVKVDRSTVTSFDAVPPPLIVSVGVNKQVFGMKLLECLDAIRPKKEVYRNSVPEQDPNKVKIWVGELPLSQ
jgi:hypothetical protein